MNMHLIIIMMPPVFWGQDLKGDSNLGNRTFCVSFGRATLTTEADEAILPYNDISEKYPRAAIGSRPTFLRPINICPAHKELWRETSMCIHIWWLSQKSKRDWAPLLASFELELYWGSSDQLTCRVDHMHIVRSAELVLYSLCPSVICANELLHLEVKNCLILLFPTSQPNAGSIRPLRFLLDV